MHSFVSRGSTGILALFLVASLSIAGPDHSPTFDQEVLVQIEEGTLFRSDLFTPAGETFGDFDGDGDVDLLDYNAFRICLSFSGPGFTVPLPCYVFDSDDDLDIDLADAAAFLNALTGSIGGVIVEAGGLVPVSPSTGRYYSGEPGISGNNALNGNAGQAGYAQDDLWYEWSVQSQPQGSGEIILSNSSHAATAYTILAPLPSGDYVFQLRVTNLTTLEFAEDTVTLEVLGG